MLTQFTGCGSGYDCSLSPSISGQPSKQTVALGERAIFTVAASSFAPLSYQWLKNGVVIPTATNASYTTPNAALVDSGSSFSVTVSNSLGSLTSSPASLTINSPSISNVRFVATTGDDSNPGTIDQPYRTIQHCAETVSAEFTCEVRQGTYRETVRPNSGITITSYNYETVVIDGSDPITGWTLDHGSIYKASAHLSTDDTNQIFVGNEMMTEARWPNGDDLFHVNWATERDGTNSGLIVDRNLPSADWTGAKVHLWSGADPFGHQTGVVTASGPGQLKLAIDETGTCPSICPVSGGYYYLFGTLNALDAEREWYFDSGSGVIYFLAPGGIDPNKIDVRGKQRQYAFDLRGRSGVTIRNIGIFASTIVTDESSANNNIDRINAQYVSHFTNLPTSSEDPDGTGFTILEVHQSDSGIIINGTNNTLQNSTVAYSAGNGVALEGNYNTVKNNLIHHVDYIGNYDSGVVLNGNGNTVQYNTIQSIGRQAILINGVINQDIGYNNLYNSMMLTRDGAEIYACCHQKASGTKIHHNWIHDTKPLIDGAGADDTAHSGVYIDYGSSGFDVVQNVLWKNRIFNIFINGDSSNSPTQNNVQSNTIPDDSATDYTITISSIRDCRATRVVNNRMVGKVRLQEVDTACTLADNNADAQGAHEMLNPSQVGCNFDGCSSAGPPAILSGGFVTPCPAKSPSQP